VTLEGAGHYIQEDAAEEIAAAIGESSAAGVDLPPSRSSQG
jgi:pimeloyl-ACP methyl ester carboxylesterase